MSLDSDTTTALGRHVDIFVDKFFVRGTRNYMRKTSRDGQWLNLGIMEKTNPEAFHESRLFSGLNLVGGEAYSFGHGFIHGYLKEQEKAQIEKAVESLNYLEAEEVIFYHDESARGLELAREMGLELNFTPVSLLEWLIRLAREKSGQIRTIDADAAVQLPCSWRPGDGTNALIRELFDLIGVRRVERKYDFDNRLCCGMRGYFGLTTGDTMDDSDRSELQARQNIEDAWKTGAKYLATTCPCCYGALASVAKEAGMVPVQMEGLVSLALYDEPLPEGLAFL